MIQKKELLMALDMLTQGSEAPVRESLRAEALSVKAKESKWTESTGIQGFGIGRKTTNSKELKDKVLKVYVEKKLPLSKCKNKVPKTVKVGSLSNAIRTDVEEIGKVEIESNTGRVRPAIPGFSCGRRPETGTFGCLVRKKGDKKSLYILSNSHVLSGSGLGKAGDVIIQPGQAVDGGKAPADVIAALSEFVPFIFTDDDTYPNYIDAAIAKVKSKKMVTSVIRKIGVPKKGIGRVRIGTKVQKTGRTTDHTIGIVTDVNYRVRLKYDKTKTTTGMVGFTDQILCTRYTAAGDSGSLVMNMDNKPVGLHFGGSPSTSFFNPIRFVLDALSIEIVTTKI